MYAVSRSVYRLCISGRSIRCPSEQSLASTFFADSYSCFGMSGYQPTLSRSSRMLAVQIIRRSFFGSRIAFNAWSTSIMQSFLVVQRASALGHFQTLSIAPGEWLVSGVYRSLTSAITENLDLSVCFPQKQSLIGHWVTGCLRPKGDAHFLQGSVSLALKPLSSVEPRLLMCSVLRDFSFFAVLHLPISPNGISM